jgi:hypothetical protein
LESWHLDGRPLPLRDVTRLGIKIDRDAAKDKQKVLVSEAEKLRLGATCTKGGVDVGPKDPFQSQQKVLIRP